MNRTGQRETMKVTTTRSTIGAEPPKPFGVHSLPQIAGDAGYGTVVLNVCPAGFWSCFVPIPFYPPLCTFWNGFVYLVPLYVGNVSLFFHLYRGLQLRVRLKSQRRH